MRRHASSQQQSTREAGDAEHSRQTPPQIPHGARQFYPLRPPALLGAADHPAEREADDVADRVTARLQNPADAGGPERISVAADPRGPAVRRMQHADAGGDAAASMAPEAQFRLAAARGRSGFALPGSLQTSFGRMLGPRARDARLFHDHHSDQLAREFGASAFSIGKDVFFRRGAYDPRSLSGKRLLAHELVHVEQDGGRGNVVRRMRHPLFDQVLGPLMDVHSRLPVRDQANLGLVNRSGHALGRHALRQRQIHSQYTQRIKPLKYELARLHKTANPHRGQDPTSTAKRRAFEDSRHAKIARLTQERRRILLELSRNPLIDPGKYQPPQSIEDID